MLEKWETSPHLGVTVRGKTRAARAQRARESSWYSAAS